MKKILFYALVTSVCYIGACKSENKEATTETTADSTTVATQPGEVMVDSVALSEETAKAAPAPASKTAASNTKAQPATKGTSNAPAAKEETTMTQQDMEYNEFPSKRASYPGGITALNKYLADNIKYPVQARENGIEGTVYASILVDEMGTLGEVSFPKPLGYGLEEEVLRVIKGMPKLIPAEDQSKPVKTKYILPVKFDLK